MISKNYAVNKDPSLSSAEELKVQRSKLNEKKVQIEKESQSEIENLNKINRERIDKAFKNNQERLKFINENLTNELDKLENQSEDRIASIKSINKEQIKNLKGNSEQNLVKERENSSKTLNEINDKTRLEAKKTRELNKKNIREMSFENKEKLKQIEDVYEEKFGNLENKNLVKLKNVEDKYSAELKKKEEFYKTKVQKKDEFNKIKLEEKTLSNTGEIKLIEAKFENDKVNLNTKKGEQIEDLKKEHTKIIDNEKTDYTEKIKEQRQTFLKNYDSNQKENEASIDILNHMVQKELVRVKTEGLDTINTHQVKSEDPFYRSVNYPSMFDFKDNNYVLEVKVPEYDKNSFFFKVEADKVTITCARRFNERLKSEEKDVSTNTYQTFSESFPLKGVIDIKGVQKTYENGTYKITIPRLA